MGQLGTVGLFAASLIGPAETSVSILNLAKFRDLFQSDAAFDQFVASFLGALKHGKVTVLTKDDFAIATLRPATEARDELQLQIAARLAANPKLLETLKSRAEDGGFKPYGTAGGPEND